ncbi:acetoin utilization protein AcuC [Pseudaestuariivita rosea]|uniref:acetoin utilization protein AcuC n=1 Tax=Pseudaestuariivita rosea TaxID=2763263 RepID=UPI001F2C0956|nr:acetoin utilization protein AcuC [Pseudaestuariivita rosea]
MFIGSEIYRTSTYGAWHPLRIPRVSTVIDLSRALGWLPRNQYVISPMAKPKALHIWHQPDYISALQQAERDGDVDDHTRQHFGLGTPSNPVFPEMYRRPATAAGASLLAGELLRYGGVVYSPAGGTHHGLPARANGFCYLNDPVLAILSLRRNGAGKIAYIDIDAHHPDGVELAFQNDPDVLMISVHEQGRWPKTGAISDCGVGNVFNLPVPRGLNDTEMQMILDRLILPLTQGFGPDAIVLQCGADAVEDDPLSNLSLSNQAHWNVVAALRPLSRRYLVLGGGGYNPWSVGRLWTGVWAVLNQIPVPTRLPDQAESVLRNLQWTGNRRAGDRPEHWYTTLEDRPRSGPVRDIVRQRIDMLLNR